MNRETLLTILLSLGLGRGAELTMQAAWFCCSILLSRRIGDERLSPTGEASRHAARSESSQATIDTGK
jgi:hypothetical protein